MHKCSKHQGPHAQVIHMDLDHVINSTAVIGNMKLQSGDLLMLSALLLQPKGFSKHCPHSDSVSHKEGFPLVFLVVWHSESLLPTPPHFLPTTASSQGWPSALLGTEDSFPLLGALEVCGDQEGSKQIHWLPETWQESTPPFSKLSCKADPRFWGRSGPHCSLAEAEVGLHQAPHLTLPCRTSAETITVHARGGAEVWDGSARCPKGISRTETGSAIGTMSASHTARGGWGCSMPGSRTTLSGYVRVEAQGVRRSSPSPGRKGWKRPALRELSEGSPGLLFPEQLPQQLSALTSRVCEGASIHLASLLTCRQSRICQSSWRPW